MAMLRAQLRTGASMPLLGLGTWATLEGECCKAVKTALDLGYRHIDTAEIYLNEREIGQALQEKMGEGVKREDIFIVTKLFETRHHPDDVLPACQNSLQKLGLDYLDLYLMHWPYASKRGDNLHPVDENGQRAYGDTHYLDTWKAMEKLVDAGLVKAIGLSNFNISQMEEILTNGRIKPAVNQVESHPYLTCNRLLKYCTEKRIVMTAYCPLGAPGVHGSDYTSALNDPIIKTIGEKYGKSAAQVSLRWQVQRGVVVIPKSSNPSRLKENSQIFDFELSEEDMTAVNNLNRDARILKKEE
uniref:NADP-dependent oxidoreductase domain-containing protein n=1 Tax=Branchiostoma floridae TaxID=7739 RepID=C3Y7N0_BRAFL|eukprot:XP_002607848.1 hypothetical protein BRAFLDRAFT_56860 [Branchiostoma floridae]